MESISPVHFRGRDQRPSTPGSLPPFKHAIHAQTFKELESLAKLDLKKNSTKKILYACAALCKELALAFFLAFGMGLKCEPYAHEASRSQEHLLREGSHLKLQVSRFQSLIESKKSAGFQKFNKELSQIAPTTPIDFAISKWRAHLIRESLKNLKQETSILIDASITGHTMLMRFTRNSDHTFDLEFANTGAGSSKNPDFHPKHKEKPHLHQTVALIRRIPAEKIFDNHFLETYCSLASFFGEIPNKSCLSDEVKKKWVQKFEKAKDKDELFDNQLDALYDCMRTLGKPVAAEPNSRYFSRPQIGGSCIASSIWSMGRILLSESELKEAETDSKIKSLLRNYKAIKNGYDQTSTRKIMVLDQVQTLMQIYKGQEREMGVLGKIENELLSSLNMKRTEVKVARHSRIDIAKYLTPAKRGKFELKPMVATFRTRDSSLKIVANWNEDKSAKFPYRVSVNKGDPNLYDGENHADSCYLLYLAIANGDQDKCEAYLMQVMKSLTKKPSPNKLRQINTTLISLLNALDAANTRSDIAKKYFLTLLIKSHDKNAIPDAYLQRRKEEYAGLEIELQLDNIWVKAINQLLML